MGPAPPPYSGSFSNRPSRFRFIECVRSQESRGETSPGRRAPLLGHQHEASKCPEAAPVSAAAAVAVEAEASAAEFALSETNINWDRLDKTKFHVIGAVLFTFHSGLLHPTAVVKTRMQVAEAGGFATSAIGSLPGRVLALTSLEVSKDIMFKNTEGLNVSEATRIALSNGVAGLVSNMVSCVYFVPLDVISQRLMVQGLPEMTTYNGPFDVIRKVMKKEGIRGLYRGFGITVATQSPATALWWGAAQHVYLEERSLGYGNDVEQKLSQLQLVAVQEKPEHWLVLVHRLSLLR
ncbi:Mitochondrial carrier protein [Musa troglodytarum]|uniref:Mitochondrial carrier protein n=1 Tax=Musa troglodytarum TaxID=320322 RepID=A0A9E7ESG6_9LILI|nr:Mitochondrial carrier protein [Musa troglodytarum]